MDRLSLNAEERTVYGKKVKKLRKDGKLPAHVFGKGVNTEHVAVDTKEFLKVFHQAGETGLIHLRIGREKVRPVLIREVQHDPILGNPIHIDFYQVDLTQKVRVAVPLVLIGEQPESVHLGETIVLQTLNEVEVEALPTDLVEKIEVDITPLKNINDAISVFGLNYDRSKLTVHADPETIIVKLAPAVSAETEALLAEQAAEQAAAAEEAKETVEVTEETKAPAEGEEAGQPEGQTKEGGEEAPAAEEGDKNEAGQKPSQHVRS